MRARAPRICIFTDTIADVNGVSRFLHALSSHAPDLIHILCSSRIAPSLSPRDNVHNTPPLFSRPMPGYPTIDIAAPSPRALHRCADALRPDAIHISTPGPVGLIGRRYALRRGLPLLGTFHTDFPAYIDHLFDDPILTRASRSFLRWFYAPFDLVLARSSASISILEHTGIPSDRIALLPPGIDTEFFHPRRRDATGAIWNTIPGARPHSIKALYVGRISIEKNLPFLASIWPRIRAACGARKLDTQLIIVGDGPHRAAMQRDLASHDACFAGFRHGQELAAMYASADLFLFPSTTDTLGQAVMEAQASGLPAIVTNQGGPAGIVLHDRTGLVLPTPAHPSADARWIDAAAHLLASPDRRDTMGRAARTHLAPMTIERTVERFIALHAEMYASTKMQPGRALARGPARR